MPQTVQRLGDESNLNSSTHTTNHPHNNNIIDQNEHVVNYTNDDITTYTYTLNTQHVKSLMV